MTDCPHCQRMLCTDAGCPTLAALVAALERETYRYRVALCRQASIQQARTRMGVSS